MSNRARTIALVALAATLGLVAALATGGDEQSDPPASSAPVADAPSEHAPQEPPERRAGRPGPDEPVDPDPTPDEVAEGPSGPRPASDPERAAAATVRAYVRALDRGAVRRLCRLFAMGALDDFDWPRERGGCAASARASLGYRDPRGLPVWRGSETTAALSAAVDGDSARVVATVVTTYRGIREPTIEDDVVYLARAGRRWLIVKPSATIHRAVGIAEFPPSVLAPPR